MSLTKTYTRDRLILHGVASDYARDNPETTAKQLSQLFAIDHYEALAIIHSLNAGTAIGADQTQKIIDWATETGAGLNKIMYHWGISERHARKIAKSVRANSPEKPKRVFATGEAIEAARAFIVANPEAPCETVARQFGVSGASLRRFRRMENVKIQVGGSQPATPRPAAKPKNTLFAVLDDGQKVACHFLKVNQDFVRLEGAKA